MVSYSNISNMFGEMVCDTLVPFYDVGISCGLPNDRGDIPPEMIMAPSELTKGHSVCVYYAMGDSMEGVGIYDGDMLLIENIRRINSYDIVVARIDGEEVLKTYYVDEDGKHWLVPANEKYDAIMLTEEMDVRFAGRLLWHCRQPRDTTRNIRQTIMRYKNKMRPVSAEPYVPTYDEVVDALICVAPLVKARRRWLGACRVLMDCKFIHKGRFDKFCELVRSILPNHEFLPTIGELQRMAVMGFSKPFSEWGEETAPVHKKHFYAYYEIGEAMVKQLPKQCF